MEVTLKAIIILAFVLSLPMRWYQNYWMGTDSFDRPPIMRGGRNQLVYLGITFVFTYAGIAGIWWFFGFWPALFTFTLKWWVGRRSWKVYFNRQVAQYADHYYREMVKAKAGNVSPDSKVYDFTGNLMPDDLATWDDERMTREAFMKAYDIVRSMRSKGE